MGTDKKLNVIEMAVRNLRARKFRTLFMCFFVVLMSATFFVSTLLMNNLEMGIKNTTDKMGADIIVVPKEGTDDIRDALFAGVPCSVFFNKTLEDKVRGESGVERVTSQLCIATLPASCCSEEVQLIAIDPETDFVVAPWLESMDKLYLEDGEVVVGSKLQAETGDSIFFYETEFTVAAKLEKTGMGYDNSVFMTRETAARLKESEAARKVLPIDELDNSISMILVDVNDALKESEITQIKRSFRNLSGENTMNAYEADDLMSGLSAQVKKLSGYGGMLTNLLVIATALALISIFSITINERKYEFGILYTLGARKRQITGIITAEALIISFVGGILGSLLAAYGVSIFKDIISLKMEIPYFDNSMEVMLPIVATCIAIAVITGIIAAVYSSYRISKGEAYRLIRESEL